MKDEIKEILENIQYAIEEDDYWEVTKETLKPLLDYITNLQQIEQDHKQVNATLMIELAKLEEENEILKHQLKVQEDLTIKNRMRKHIYKSRCEKASEYFKYQLENLDFYEDTKARMLCAMGITLLQNGGEKDDR